jgi:hypothetical protein
MRVVATGISSIVSGNSKETVDAFNKVIEGMFPYAGKLKDKTDADLIGKMTQEVGKGNLFFSPIVTKTLRTVVQKVGVSDDFKQKLQNRIKQRRT